MKYITMLILTAITIGLASCSGSEYIQGSWFATNSEGKEVQIVFEEKQLSIIDNKGESRSYEYTQNQVSFENTVWTYGILLDDGRNYSITFPNSENMSQAIMKNENGNVLYTLGRDGYLNQEDIYKLE